MNTNAVVMIDVVEDILDGFEGAWRSGETPDIDRYLTKFCGPSSDELGADRTEVLLDLIPLDLEYRWREPSSALRGPLPPRPRLEHYLARYPELEQPPGIPLPLVSAEYRIRRLWGDQPDIGEYLARFPSLAASLPDELERIDDEIAREHSARSSDRLTVPAPPSRLQPTAGGPPRMIDGFEILGEIGRGGMSVVYKARERKLDRFVAIKMIADGRDNSTEYAERFRAEAHAVARLRHPNIIAIHAIGESRGRPYLTLELAEGGNLSQTLGEKPMGAREAAVLVESLARAVHAAHEAGVVHRDLKPSNILLTADGVPKVGDFGLAKLLDSDVGRTLSGQPIGTPSYMSPEQAEGHAGHVGPSTDIYALGAILYQILTGRPPFLGESAMETLKLVTTTEAVPPRRLRPDVPLDLETICLKCLQKSPARRCSSALDLADDLRRFLDGRPIVARRTGPLERSWKWARRHPWQSATAAIVVLGTALLVGLTYRHDFQLRAEIARTQARAAEARGNYSAARSTIQGMIARLNDPRFKGTPRLKELRRDQFEDALAFYDGILRRFDPNDPTVREDTAHTHNQIGMMQFELGRRDEAERHVRRTLDVIASLRSDEPDNPEYLGLQVVSLNQLANYLGGSGRNEEACTAGAEAVRLAGNLADMTPGNVGHRELVAVCHDSYAGRLASLGRVSAARDHYHKAIEIREQLDLARSPALIVRHAETLLNDGIILWQLNQVAIAEQRFRRVEKLFESVPAEGIGVCLARLYVNWGGMLQVAGRHKEAIALSDRGLKSIEPYLQQEPNDAATRELCLKLHGNRAYAFASLGKHRESVADWEQVVALSDEPIPAQYHMELAFGLMRLRMRDRALSQVRLAEADRRITAGHRYNFACLYSLAAASAKAAMASSDRRSPVVESYITQGLSWFKSAADDGHFKDPANAEFARKDPDLQRLRERPEFEQILHQGQSPVPAESAPTTSPARPVSGPGT
jgi:tetratricopeptide (TPR) repeat protein/tRNA A-37 threonylcarbamoyl transferase component Bud32